MIASSPSLSFTTKPKHSMLPLLTVLFIISYGLLTLLVVEQNRTVMNQRGMIQQLLSDSAELAALKVKVNAKHPHAVTAPKAAPHAPNGGGTADKSVDPMKGNRQSSKLSKPERLNPPRLAADKPDIRRSAAII